MKKVVILILSSLTLCSCNNLDPYTNFINEIYIIETKVDVDYGRNFSVGTYYGYYNTPILLDEYITISYINNQVLEYKQNIRRVLIKMRIYVKFIIQR